MCRNKRFIILFPANDCCNNCGGRKVIEISVSVQDTFVQQDAGLVAIKKNRLGSAFAATVAKTDQKVRL